MLTILHTADFHIKDSAADEYIFYSGSLYSLDSGEMEAKGFYLHRMMSKHHGKSTFIEVPSTRRVKLAFDFVADPTGIDHLDELLWNRPADDLSGKVVHMAFRVFQDQAGLLDKAKIEAWLADDCLAAGAKVEILRVPRENVRSARYFDLRTYKDKLIEQARLRDEPEALTPGILDKLDQLESLPPEDLIKRLSTL